MSPILGLTDYDQVLLALSLLSGSIVIVQSRSGRWQGHGRFLLRRPTVEGGWQSWLGDRSLRVSPRELGRLVKQLLFLRQVRGSLGQVQEMVRLQKLRLVQIHARFWGFSLRT